MNTTTTMQRESSKKLSALGNKVKRDRESTVMGIGFDGIKTLYRDSKKYIYH